MPISSLVVETVPERTADVSAALGGIGGVEVVGSKPGRVAIVIDTPTTESSYAIASGLIGIDGVINTSLVYVNNEDELLGDDDDGR